MGKPRIIRISSQKGGVGKTTLTTNLSVAMATLSSAKILVVDTDTTNPSVGFQMGFVEANIGFDDVVNKRAELASAVVVHMSSGVHVLPGTIRAKYTEALPADATDFMKSLLATDYDFILMDTAPGFTQLTTENFIDEALIVTTPTMSSCTSSVRLGQVFDNHAIPHTLVVNRFKNKLFEISMREVRALVGGAVLGPVPDNEDVEIAEAQHIPAYLLYARSDFSAAIRDIALYMLERNGGLQKYGQKVPQERESRRGGILGFIMRLFSRR